MSTPQQNQDITKIRETCPVFRVLIIGRANAGKTTILQKVCNVDPNTDPIVHDAHGRKVSPPTGNDTDGSLHYCQRGQHDIKYQIMYPGSHFIFHDSRGIEAGSADELRIIRDFLRERESQTLLENQLHAIW
ncbi:hypothetical protein CONPUDRAFT_61870 [Coniophora puteana RWD-64-598 SS2]|uniref:G domain-containing protein n=1 Tax=Coniophora puteana (strain RWD-64-598) TaxID=741705 RepID=A0A5M3MGK0_CONPW|nr:uncharacterized protein CONPUDRAFT_61870 [Coniophora puteana RWD-64-598 SS2]EIW77745.1 hypothetical protein CONPUDRAFT_61870 [Coniophora puteana RWD-64-598 SS2]